MFDIYLYLPNYYSRHNPTITVSPIVSQWENEFTLVCGSLQIK